MNVVGRLRGVVIAWNEIVASTVETWMGQIEMAGG